MILFSEQQKFKSTFLSIIYIFCIGMIILFLYGILQQVFFTTPFGDKPANTGVLVFSTVILILIIIGFKSTEFIVEITETSINYRWKPFQKKATTIPISSIDSLSLVTINTIALGYRISYKYGTMHLTGGSNGIYIISKGGSKNVIQIRNVEALKEALQKIIPQEKLDLIQKKLR